MFAHTHLVGRAKAAGFDGLYTYDVATWNGNTFARICTQAHRAGLLCAPSVGPGYDARLATTDEMVRPRLLGATYDRMWRAAVRADADVVTITSYNEWQEGTQIEPARSQVAAPGLRRGVGQARATRAARVPRRDSALDGALPRLPRSVERAREPAAVRDAHGIVLPEPVEDRHRELAKSFALVRCGVRDGIEDQLERTLVVAGLERRAHVR